jgi:hypothetical protein
MFTSAGDSVVRPGKALLGLPVLAVLVLLLFSPTLHAQAEEVSPFSDDATTLISEEIGEFVPPTPKRKQWRQHPAHRPASFSRHLRGLRRRPASASASILGTLPKPRVLLVPRRTTTQTLVSEQAPSSAAAPHGSSGGSILATSNPDPWIKTSSTAETKRIEIKLPSFICKILSWFGAKCPTGSRVVIIIRKPGSTTTPTPPPTTTSPPPTTTPTPTVPSGGVSTQKAFMRQQFGITAKDGDGAVWSEAQLKAANAVLAKLPPHFRSFTKTITRDRMYRNANVLGYVRMGIPEVHLTNSACKEGTFQGTLVHEMVHTFQAENPTITRSWEKTFWPLGKFVGPIPRSVSSYGNTQPLEDMAESVRMYYQSGARMKQEQPKRYEFIKTHVMSGREFL